MRSVIKVGSSGCGHLHTCARCAVVRPAFNLHCTRTGLYEISIEQGTKFSTMTV